MFFTKESIEDNIETIVAMAVAAIAEETRQDFRKLRVVSFREIQKSSLEKYLTENKIEYKKYQLGE